METKPNKDDLLKLPLWDPSHLAEYLGMSIGSVRNMVTRGEVPGLKRINGKLWRVHVQTFIDSFGVNEKYKKNTKYKKGQRIW